MKEMWLDKKKKHKRVLKFSFGDTRVGIHNTEFHNHYTICTYLHSPQLVPQLVLIVIFRVSCYERFHRFS